MNLNKRYLFAILLVIAGWSKAQNIDLKLIKQKIDNQDFNAADSLIKKIKKQNLSEYDSSVLNFESGRIASLFRNDLISSYKYLLKAKQKCPKDSLDLLFKINDELIYTYISTIENVISPDQLIKENCRIAQITEDARMLINCDYYQLTDINYLDPDSSRKGLDLLYHSKQLASENDLISTLKNIEYNIGVAHSLSNTPDSALFYFDKLIPYYKKQQDYVALKDLYNNKAQALKKTKRYEEAITYFKKSIDDHYPIENFKKEMVTRNLAETYYLNKDFEESATLYKDKIKISDSVKREQSARAIEELETKYQTAEKEKVNLQLTADKEKQRAQIYALSGGAIILFIASLFIYNNQRKKKLIAQKEQELEKQRADTILKNQELATIDAMITGQEKERKRLAEELHDHLGSSLTTVKLYFENLKNNVQDEQGLEVYHRTEQILDDTYETIRSMSHAKNSGVLASRGLIPSIENLADKISKSGKLSVNVIHHGLDSKLENSIELIIFRIIQELLSNVVKHAEATEVFVNLTSYEDNLNIMVEDNGKGFDASLLSTKEGIGLNSIEKRIESIEGSFEIDSSLKRGTTINIDIPYYDQPSYS